MTESAWCPGERWANVPRFKARCADCGREFKLIGREFGRGWGRTRLPRHKKTVGGLRGAVDAWEAGHGRLTDGEVAAAACDLNVEVPGAVPEQ